MRRFRRRTRTLFPVSDQLLKPKVTENVAENLKKEQNRQKKYYGQHATSIPTLSEGDHVIAKKDPKSTWKLTKIKEEITPPSPPPPPHSNNKVFRRNRSHLMKVQQQSPAMMENKSTNNSGIESLRPTSNGVIVQSVQETTSVVSRTQWNPRTSITSRYGRAIKPNILMTN